VIDLPQRQRVADIVRAELPFKTIYSVIAVNLALILFLTFGVFHVYQRLETQELINTGLKSQIEGLKVTVEFGPRLTRLEEQQLKQTWTLELIARKLGVSIEEE